MMGNNASSFPFLIPPYFMGAAGISSENKASLAGFFDDFPICQWFHADTITGRFRGLLILLLFRVLRGILRPSSLYNSIND